MKKLEPTPPRPMIWVSGWHEAWALCIDDELLQILQQLDPAACASRGRWGG